MSWMKTVLIAHFFERNDTMKVNHLRRALKPVNNKCSTAHWSIQAKGNKLYLAVSAILKASVNRVICQIRKGVGE